MGAHDTLGHAEYISVNFARLAFILSRMPIWIGAFVGVFHHLKRLAVVIHDTLGHTEHISVSFAQLAYSYSRLLLRGLL